MSRARPVKLPNDEVLWFDMSRQSERASDDQLELLAVIEQVDIDDLLDTVLTQAEVLKRLRFALGQAPVPTDVLERRAKWREHRQLQPKCRLCGCEGNSTKHHFVPRWLLRELAYYGTRWADRSKNCIPVCIHCHRNLHMRGGEVKSICSSLSPEEKEFAHRALEALAEERPRLLLLVARGSEDCYETQLVWDWLHGMFSSEAKPWARHLRSVA